MEHVMFLQKVKEEKREEYIKYHKEAWKELLIATKKAGFERQILWLLGNNVLIYSMAEDFNQAISNLKKTDIFKKWQKKMDELLEEAQDYSEKGKILELEKIYDLEMQLESFGNYKKY